MLVHRTVAIFEALEMGRLETGANFTVMVLTQSMPDEVATVEPTLGVQASGVGGGDD